MEYKFSVPCGPAELIGFIDYRDLTLDPPLILDHKTTSNLKYVVPRDELPRHLQLLTYAYASLHENPPEKLRAKLVYYRTKGHPVSQEVSTVIPWEDVAAHWKRCEALAEEMTALKFQEDGSEIEGNPAACFDFGGCFFAPICPQSQKNRARNASEKMLTTTPTDAALKARAMLGISTPTPEKAADINPPDAAPVEHPTESLIDEAAEYVNTYRRKLGTKSIGHKALAEILTRLGLSADSSGEVLQRANDTIEPDALPTKRRGKLSKVEIEQYARKVAAEVNTTGESLAASDAVKAALDGATYTAKRVEQITKAGQALGLFEYDADAGQVIPTQAAAPTPPPANVTAPTPPPSEVTAPMGDVALLVLVDCLPERTAISHVTDILAPLQDEIAEAHGVQYYNLVEYAAGRRELAAKLLALIHKQGLTGAVAVDSHDPCAGEILAVLRRVPGVMVIQGIRG